MCWRGEEEDEELDTSATGSKYGGVEAPWPHLHERTFSWWDWPTRGFLQPRSARLNNASAKPGQPRFVRPLPSESVADTRGKKRLRSIIVSASAARRRGLSRTSLERKREKPVRKSHLACTWIFESKKTRLSLPLSPFSLRGLPQQRSQSRDHIAVQVLAKRESVWWASMTKLRSE